jgi:hypothetical protein
MVGVITHHYYKNNIKNKYKYIMGCINKLTAAVSYDCNVANRAKSGLEAKAVLINKSDIDF